MKNIVLIAVLIFLFASPSFAEASSESAFNRVVTSGVLKCGYGSWEPGVIKDPTTGKMRGIFVEMLEATGKMAGFTVEWTAETDWGQIGEALRSRKIDAFCAGMANDASRGKYLAYTHPFTYWAFDVLVRADDTRFPEGKLTLADINKPEFGMAYTEGDVLETIVKTELPDIKRVALPPLGSPADNMMHLMSKKTDLIVFPKVMLQNYEKQNPKGQIRLVELKEPLRIYGNVIAIDIHETALQNYLNAAVDEFVNSGSYMRIKSKYDADYPGAFLRPVKAYVP